jgi:hypothetical protein
VRPAALALLILLLVPAGSAWAATPGEVAAALAKDPIYVEDGAKPTLSAPEQGRLRIQVARQDIGRVKVAVLAQASADRAGGLGATANAIDRGLEAKGNLIVVAGPGIHLITSYAPVEPATDALRKGVQDNNDSSLADRLSAGIKGIAEVDPGASGDLGAGRTESAPNSAFPDLDETTDSIASTVKLVLLIIAAAVALPFVIGALWILLRIRRRRRDEAEVLAEERDAFRKEVVALGEQIQELDLDVSMPDADPAGRAEYERALAVYDEANTALTMRRSPAALQRARAAIKEGNERMANAKRLLEAQLAARDAGGA